MEQEKIDRLQWILDDAVARGEIPGAILMVRKEGKETVYLESGYGDIEAKKPVARDSIYRLYSMSKPITATAVMILVERGELHRLFNDGREPLVVLMVCIAHTPMPEG